MRPLYVVLSLFSDLSDLVTIYDTLKDEFHSLSPYSFWLLIALVVWLFVRQKKRHGSKPFEFNLHLSISHKKPEESIPEKREQSE